MSYHKNIARLSDTGWFPDLVNHLLTKLISLISDLKANFIKYFEIKKLYKNLVRLGFSKSKMRFQGILNLLLIYLH